MILSLFLFYYSGSYGDGVTLETLKEFHRRRVQILANAGADLIAFETIPNKVEAQVMTGFFLEIAYWYSSYMLRPQLVKMVSHHKLAFLSQ